jgi:hypothetical protein
LGRGELQELAFLKEEEKAQRHTQKRRPLEDEGREWSDTVKKC